MRLSIDYLSVVYLPLEKIGFHLLGEALYLGS
jgi:hypothetical protein